MPRRGEPAALVQARSWTVVGALAVAVLAALCGGAARADATLEAGVLTIGSDLSYPPYDYLGPGGAPAGLDAELVAALAKQLGWRERIVDTRFENLILGLRAGRFDAVVSTLYVTAERAQAVDFVPYMRTGVSIAVAASSGFRFDEPSKLCGHRVGSIKGAAWLVRLSQLNDTDCRERPVDSREFPTSSEVTQALLSGAVDAQLEDSAVLQDAVGRTGKRLAITSKENLYPVVVGMAVRKDSGEIARKLREALRALQEDGSYGRLLAKYNVSQPTDTEVREALAR